jgi:hypothetical protein
MSIAIRGVRLKSLSISRNDKGEEEITGDYELISTADKVLAKQGFNGYNEIKVSFSAETMKAFNAFTNGVKEDVNSVLGLTEEK